MDYEKLGLFYLGRRVDAASRQATEVPLLYDAADLVTHAVILGMTGSGKTGLGIGLIEEAAIDGIPVLAIDPKGDLSNLLLTFPELRPSDFVPWVNADDARVQGLTAEAFGEREAARWSEGLREWGQSGERIARLQQSVEFRVYTPGSRAARPLSVLSSFEVPPPAIVGDPELMAERASAATSSVLTLAGIDAEPLRSREHILVSTLLSESWRQQRPMDLAALIAAVQSPPLQRVGVLDLDAFYSPADRFKLAMDLNRILAAPDFDIWREGDPLDIGALLYGPDGRPRVTILSIAHLDDRERMFVVSLVLNELVSWMRGQRGTSTLRAMLYMDEVMGFLPPVAMPPSKPPMLTLLKQARAFGVGVTLATQNPIDLDYKALANAGTWFLGRLQTERDKMRLLDGLEGAQAAAGHRFDRASVDRLLSSLEKRTFLLHNVHEDEPVLFKTRWTLSYLRGPLGRDELSRLNPGSEDPGLQGSSGGSPVGPGLQTRPEGSSPVGSPPSTHPSTPPVLDPAIPVYFAPGDGDVWSPVVVGAARVIYTDSKLGIDDTRDVVVWTPIGEGAVAVDWDRAEPAAFRITDLMARPPVERPFDPVPAAATSPKKYSQWAKEFAQWVAHSQIVELWRSPHARIVSRPDESEREFRIRLQTVLREQRDAEMVKVRERAAAKVASFEDRVRRAEAALERQKQQASDSKLQAGVSLAATIFGAMLGRKAVSATTLGRATTTARGVGRIGREAEDVARAEEELRIARERRDEFARTVDADLNALGARWDAARDEPLERVLVKPKRGGVSIQLVALVFVGRQDRAPLALLG